MKIALFIYLILSVIFLIDIILSISVLEFVRQAINVRERPKLVIKIDELKSMKKFVIIWPYVLYRLVRENAKK
jgi:hypothetical protein